MSVVAVGTTVSILNHFEITVGKMFNTQIPKVNGFTSVLSTAKPKITVGRNHSFLDTQASFLYNPIIRKEILIISIS